MPTSNSEHEAAWQRYYSAPERRTEDRHTIDPRAMQGVFDNLPLTSSVVDVGCGNGRAIPALEHHGVISSRRTDSYLGVDFSEQQLSLAGQRYPQFRFENCRIEDLGERFPCAFDGFVCNSMLMCVARSRADYALRSVAQSLKPGAQGFFMAGIGTKDTDTGYLRFPDFPAVYFYAAEELVQLVEETGYQIRQKRVISGHGIFLAVTLA